MSQRYSAASGAAQKVADVSIALQLAMQDGTLEPGEYEQVRALLSEAYCSLELQALSIEAAVQLLRIPSSAPNRHLRERQKEVSQLIERFTVEKERASGA